MLVDVNLYRAAGFAASTIPATDSSIRTSPGETAGCGQRPLSGRLVA
jgi:hypothetical protein